MATGPDPMAAPQNEEGNESLDGAFGFHHSGYKPMRSETGAASSTHNEMAAKINEAGQTIKDLPSSMMKRVVQKKKDDQPLLENGRISPQRLNAVSNIDTAFQDGSQYYYEGPEQSNHHNDIDDRQPSHWQQSQQLELKQQQQQQQLQQQQLQQEQIQQQQRQKHQQRNQMESDLNRRQLNYLPNQDASSGDLASSDTIVAKRKSQREDRITLSRMSSSRGSEILFRNVSFVAPVKRYPWSKVEKRIVLNSVSGVMRPGLNAIMGPTGSGKSSLLDLLAGRKNPSFVNGEVLVDGAEQPSNFKCVSGYVVQDDIVMGTLSVRENLQFSAALRLPSHRSDAERKAKVESVIEELGLTKVANSKIGTDLIRGVSGGERKRTNIGMELITDPSVLFLDEPTTGLDAFTAGSVVKTLKNLADRGRTIILSIHQPKYSIYRLFDTLSLLVAGEVIYHGEAGEKPLEYFQRIGYVCETHNSPPDFFMDIVHGEIMARCESEDNLREIDNDPMEAIDTEIQSKKTHIIGQKLIKKWKESRSGIAVQEEVERLFRDSLHGGAAGFSTTIKRDRINYPTSFFNQLKWVSWRTGLNLFRNPESSVIQLAVYLFFAVSIGTVYFQIDSSLESGIQNRQGLFFFMILQMVFVNLGAIEVFIKERVIFVHESSSGFYRISVYFLSKIFCDMLPIKTLPVILFMPIVYFMTGLKLDFGAFFFYELTLVLATCAACGVAFFISASVSIFGIANIFISIIYVFMMVFGGFLNNIGSIAAWLSWCKYLSVFNYAYNSLSVNEFVGLTFCPQQKIGNITQACRPGFVELDYQQIPYSTGWDYWSNQLGMLALTIFFLTLCYVQLRRIEKYK